MANDLNRSIKIYIDNSDAQLKATQLEAKIQELNASLEQLAATGQKDTTSYAQKEKAYNQATGALAKYKTSVAETTRVLNNLSGATYKELNSISKTIQSDLKGMERNTDEYRAKLQLLQTVEKERTTALAAMRVESGSQQTMWSRMADGINRYSMMAMTGIAALAGITMKLNEYRQAALDLESSKANLKALTGLDDQGVNYLTDQAKKLSTSITEDGVRITQSAKDIEDGFTKMGSKRPELLKNKEALAEVTKEALTLAAAGKMEAEPAFEALAATMNQFNMGADQAKRAINVLGAGALAGSAEVSDLTDSLKNVGAVANGANMSLEQTVGVLEVLAEKQLVGEEAGTKLRGAIVKMQAAGLGYASGSFNFRDALIELTNKLKGLHTEMARDAKMHEVFGLENITAGKILVSNIAEYDKMTKAVTGTNVAIDQAIINTSTMSAKLAQAKNEMQLAGMELADKLAPALYMVTSGTRDVMKALVALMPYFPLLGKMLVMVAGYFIAYNAVKIKNNILLKEGIGLRIKDAIVLKALMIQEAIAKTVTEDMTLATKAAAIAQALWNATIKANPWGWAIGILTTLGGVLWMLIGHHKELTDLEQAHLNIEKQVSESYNSEADKLKILTTTLNNNKLSYSARMQALNEIKAMVPEYHASLTKEGTLINNNTEALDEYLVKLKETIRLEASKKELSKMYDDERDIQKKIAIAENQAKKAQENALNQGINNPLGALTYSSLQETNVNSLKDQLTIKQKDIKAIEKEVQDGIKKTSNAASPKKGDKRLVDGVPCTYDGTKWVPDKKAGGSGGSGGGDDDAKKELQKRLDQIEQEKTAEENILKQKYAQGIIGKLAYENQLYLIEQEALMKRYKLYEKDREKQGEEYNKMLDARIKFLEKTEKLHGETFEKTNVDMQKTTEDAQKGLKNLASKETKEVVSELAIRLKQIDIAEQRELNNKNLTEKEKAEIEKKYNKIRLQLTILTEEEKEEILSNAFGALSKVLDKNTAASKAAAIAQATMDTYVAANKALATYPPPWGAIAAGTAIVEGLANVKNILNVNENSSSNATSESYNSGARVLQNANGKYDVIGASDGKLYQNIPFVGSAQTGVVKQPTLIAEDGGEMVISSMDMSRLQRHINYPLVVEAINDARINRVPQRAAGKYDIMQDNYQTRTVIDNAGITSDPELKIMLANTNALLEHLKKNGVHTKFSFYQHDQARTIYDNSLKGGSR